MDFLERSVPHLKILLRKYFRLIFDLSYMSFERRSKNIAVKYLKVAGEFLIKMTCRLRNKNIIENIALYAETYLHPC